MITAFKKGNALVIAIENPTEEEQALATQAESLARKSLYAKFRCNADNRDEETGSVPPGLEGLEVSDFMEIFR